MLFLACACCRSSAAAAAAALLPTRAPAPCPGLNPKPGPAPLAEQVTFYKKFDSAGPKDAIVLPDITYYILGMFSTVAEVRPASSCRGVSQGSHCHPLCPRSCLPLTAAPPPAARCPRTCRCASSWTPPRCRSQRRQEREGGTNGTIWVCPPPQPLSPHPPTPHPQIVPPKVRNVLTTVFSSDPDLPT